MIKTLRITSIIAAIAATVLLVLPAVYGVRSDPKIEEFIKSPGTVDKFTAAKGQNSAQKNAETSPLVKQAADLGHYLNPPPPPPPKVQPGAAPQVAAVPAPPVPIAVKFDLIATSYYASHPEQSFVLIDEPGKGIHWVKQGSAVGHLTIETVKDGAIIVRDDQRTSEMTVKVQESWRKLLKNPPPSTRPSSSSAEPASPAAQVPTGRPGLENPIQPSPVTAARPGAAPLPARRSPRQGATPSAAERITPAAQPAPAGMQPPPAAEITPPPQETPVPEDSPAIKEKNAEIDKLVSQMGSSEMTKDEEKKLDEVFKQIEKLGEIREAESVNDVNAKDVNK
ncbi:MAG: hypothetical protein ABSG22_07525 [Sedimentisphaerales bacterium]